MITKGLKDRPEVKSFCCSCKGQGSVPSTFVVTHDHLKLQLQGIQCSLPTHARVYLHTCKQTLKDKLIIKIFLNYIFKIQGKETLGGQTVISVGEYRGFLGLQPGPLHGFQTKERPWLKRKTDDLWRTISEDFFSFPINTHKSYELRIMPIANIFYKSKNWGLKRCWVLTMKLQDSGQIRTGSALRPS